MAVTDTLKRAIEATRKEDHSGAAALFSEIYADGYDKGPTKGLSYCAVSLAATQKSYQQAIALCERAIAAEESDPNHYTNLARVHVLAGDRKSALAAIERGLKRLPHNGVINRFWNSIGRRSEPTLPFLSRDNVINKTLGKARHAKKKTARTRRSSTPAK